MGGSGTGTPVTASTLCTLAQVKSHLGITDTTDDTKISALIERVDDAFSTHWGVPTVPVTTAARNVMVDGPTVYADELVTVTSVVDASGNALTYDSIPGRNSGDHIRWLEITSWPLTWDHPYTQGYVVVTGTWGYAAMPYDVTHAAILTAAVWYKRQKGGGEVDNSYIGNLDAIPKEARQIMDARRTVRF